MVQEAPREKFLSAPSDKNIPAFWSAEKTKYQSLLFFKANWVGFKKKKEKPRAIQPLEEDLMRIQGLNQTGIVLGENQQEY